VNDWTTRKSLIIERRATMMDIYYWIDGDWRHGHDEDYNDERRGE
jgi:hypothetical protein